MSTDPWSTPPPIRNGSESDRTTESVVGSNERTNERTDVEIGSGRESSTSPNVHARTGDSTGRTLRDLLDGDGEPRRDATEAAVAHLTETLANRNRPGSPDYRFAGDIARDWSDLWELGNEPRRWPVLRSGEREPIPWLMRLSIYRRHQFICAQCGTDLIDGEPEVDHCIPWSAGGTDDSDNLRLLCHGCNQRRSNWIDLAHVRIHRPTTWWCFDCWSSETHDDRHELQWRNGINLGHVLYVDDEHVATPPEQVYCAFCQMHSFSTHFLVGSRGQDLIRSCEPQGDAR